MPVSNNVFELILTFVSEKPTWLINKPDKYYTKIRYPSKIKVLFYFHHSFGGQKLE
jgi:hypothetical protein